MLKRKVIHATLVAVNDKGILIKGDSQSGKSDLALRLIMRYNAMLVADDAVNIVKFKDKIIGQSPEKLAGLLEVYGVGIAKIEHIEKIPIDLVVNLVNQPSQIERMPKKLFANILGVEIMQIDLYAKGNSAPEKVLLKLRGCLLNVDE